MGKIMEKAWGLAKSLSPGLLVSGAASMMKTTKGVSKESPEVQENFRYNTKSVIGYTAVAIIVGIAAYQIGSTVSNHFRTMDEINLEAAKATFGSRRRERSDDEFPDDGDDNSEEEDIEKKAKLEDYHVKNEISKILGLFETTNQDGESMVPFEQRTSHKISPKYIIPGVLKEGDRLVLVGTPGSGKSLFATEIGFAASEGRLPTFIDNSEAAHEPMPVDYYDSEHDEDDRRERYGQYNTNSNFVVYKNCKYRTLYYLLRDIWNRSQEVYYPNRLLLLDNIYALMPTLTNEEARIFLNGLDLIQQKLLEKGSHLAIILITHTTKDVRGIPYLKDVAGSANLSRFGKSVVSLFAFPNDERIALVTNKRRYDKNDKSNIIMKIVDKQYLHPEFIKYVSTEELSKEIRKQTGETDFNQESEPYDEIFERYLAAFKVQQENLDKYGKPNWKDIKEKTGVYQALFETWEKKYGKLKYNEFGDIIKSPEINEEKES